MSRRFRDMSLTETDAAEMASARFCYIDDYDRFEARAKRLLPLWRKLGLGASGWKTIDSYQDGDVVDVWLKFSCGHGERWCAAYQRDDAWRDSLTGEYLGLAYDAWFEVTHFMAPPPPPEVPK